MNIIVDFDGVIHSYHKGWHDGTIYGTPVPGTSIAFRRLLDAGHNVIIFSTRATGRTVDGKEERGQFDDMAEWLRLYDIPYTSIYGGPGKPMGHVYIDDRAIQFRGDWGQTVGEILLFKPWTTNVSKTIEPVAPRPAQGAGQ